MNERREGPRLLAIMGSGETAPTMVKVHRGLLDRLGRGREPTPAVLLDTPYGFQENAEIISARAVEYFRQSVGHAVDVATWRGADTGEDDVTRERATSLVRAARYVFAGPGSPTYALDRWAGSVLPRLLADKLERGGCVTFASAAALTLGVCTVPVYEVYKVGARPQWVPGLDLLAVAGLRAAVIPHYDNAEGGNHDTRFCYLGERRLSLLEETLADDTFVLGVDEHTACLIDVDARTATVAGNGRVTVRRHGTSEVFAAGTTVPLDQLATASRPSAPAAAPVPVLAPAPAGAPRAYGTARAPDDGGGGGEPPGVMTEAERLRRVFLDAVEGRDVDGALSAVLELEQAIVDWSRDSLQSDETDRARAVLRELVVGLGDLARNGARDPGDVAAPFVEAILEARRAARDKGDFGTADGLRTRLIQAGVVVNDSPDGTAWSMATESAAP